MKYAVNISIIATFAFFGLASFLPMTSMWGFNHLNFLPDIYLYLYVFIFLLIIYLMIGPVPEKTIENTINKINGWLWKTKILPRLIFITICSILFYLFRIETQFLGDSNSWLEIFGRGEATFFRITEPGSVFIVQQLQNLLGGYTKETAYTAFFIMSIGSGVIYFYNVLSIIGKLIEDKCIRILALSTLLFSGSILMFFGYVEFYPILWASVSIFINLSINYLRKGSSLLTVTGAYLLSILMHLQAIYFLPGFSFLIVRKFKRPEIRKIGYFVMAVGAIALLVLLIWLYGTKIKFKLQFMPFFEGRPTEPEYTVFSLLHFLEIFNLAMVIFPGILILFGLWLSTRKKIICDPITAYLSLLSFGSLLFLFLFRPTLSMGRDWDLMSLCLITPALLLLYQRDKCSIFMSKRTIFIYVLITFFCTFSFLTTGIKTIPAEKRFYTLLGPRDEDGWVIYTNYILSKGDTTYYKELCKERFNRFPGYRNTKLAYNYIDQGEYGEALRLAQELIKREPYNHNYLQLMGYAYREMGQYDSSEVYYNKTLALRYKYDVLNQIGQLYIKQKRFDKAIDILHKAHRLAPDTTSIIEALALTYIHKKQYDIALAYADTLFMKDSHSPGALLIKLTVAAWEGDWKAARIHYLDFLKYGQGRSDYETMREFYKDLK